MTLMTTGAMDINIEPGCSGAADQTWPPGAALAYSTMAPDSSTFHLDLYVPRCSMAHRPPTWSQMANQTLGKFTGLGCNRSHRH